jgi:hypothetical protein
MDTPLYDADTVAQTPETVAATQGPSGLDALPTSVPEMGSDGQVALIPAPGFHLCLVPLDGMSTYRGQVPGGMFARAQDGAVLNWRELEIDKSRDGLLIHGTCAIYVTREEVYQQHLARERKKALERAQIGTQTTAPHLPDGQRIIRRPSQVDHSMSVVAHDDAP